MSADGTRTGVAQAEAMVVFGSGTFGDGDGVTGDQVVLVSPSDCANYWHPGPEYTDLREAGAYDPLVPGQAEPWKGSLRAAAPALADHDRRVAAREPHVRCARRAHPEDFDFVLDEAVVCPCDSDDELGPAVR